MHRLNLYQKIIYLVIASCLVAGCGVMNNGSKILPKLTPVTTSTEPYVMTKTATRTMTPTGTLTPTNTPRNTYTPTGTPTTRLPTWTPPATMKIDDAMFWVDYYHTLDYDETWCHLPCWWGTTPGVDTWEGVHRLFGPMALMIYEGSVSYAEMLFPVKKSVNKNKYLSTKYFIQDGIIESMEVDTGNIANYRFYKFLENNGQPGEVWIRAYKEPYRGFLPFAVALFYPDRGFIAEYETQGQIVGERVKGCIYRESRAVMGLWSPAIAKYTFYEAAKEFSLDPDGWEYLPLEEASGMDIETFYNQFKKPNNTWCIETPKELWNPVY